MQASEVCARDFRRVPVGRLIGSTKIKYEWEVVVGRELLCFTALHSKLSKSFRLFLNEVPLLERADPNNDISLLVLACRHSFAFSKKNDEVRLAVNSRAFDQLAPLPSIASHREFSTWEAKRQRQGVDLSDTKTSLYNTMDLTGPQKLVNFTFEWKEDVCSVRRDASIFSPSLHFGDPGLALAPIQQLPIPTPSPPPEPPVPPAPSGFNFLNDSGELYMHEFMYLFTQEVPEDPEVVREVNGLTLSGGSDPPSPPAETEASDSP